MVPKSLFLEFFTQNAERLRAGGELIGDILFVEKIKFEPPKVGRIILAQSADRQINGFGADMPTFYRVLMAGAGYYDDQDPSKTIPLETQPGDIILVPSGAVRLFSSFPGLELAETDILGVVRDGDKQWRFKGEAAFSEFLRDFNQATQAEVQRRRPTDG